MAGIIRPRSTHSNSITSNPTKQQGQQQQPATLAKRLLFPHLPPGSDLPPLFVSPTCLPELNAEAYDFLALALRAFVNTWWTKITRYDKEFLPEITIVLMTVLRTFETRMISTDFSLFTFSVAPALITQHYRDYRHAASKVSTSYAMGGAVPLPHLFHQLQPHVAISPEGKIDEEYFRQAFDHVLKLCLPPQDYAPEVERYIVREIILKVLVKDVIPRVTQPWFIQRTILDLLGPSLDAESDKPPSVSPPSHNHHAHFSFHSILVFFLSAVQSISGIGLALIQTYKQTLSTIKLVNHSTPPTVNQRRASEPLRTARQAPISPTRSARSVSPPLSSYASAASSTPSLHADIPPPNPQRLFSHYARQPLTMISELFTMHERFATSTVMHTLCMICAATTPFMDRLLTHLLYTRILCASSILFVLRLSKRTLFPNGYPGPPPIDPTPEEQIIIRQQLLRRLREQVPAFLVPVLLGSSPERTIEDIISPLDDAACNMHLAILLVDALLLSIFPEMGVEGSAENADMDIRERLDDDGKDWTPEISRTTSAMTA
ncbi:PXA domain-containing protein [Suillus clintonianus]|uniref:PXA domain-containing protein n=1 Tax=Suillus clintonianus TaxID=1904413 RepID=UPI001B883A9A|nr:PXA domain-containing protein [Suillus clintonianus]KAG2123573.1 PXA domain-containing protein [Suillus clintonianus]